VHRNKTELKANQKKKKKKIPCRASRAVRAHLESTNSTKHKVVALSPLCSIPVI